MVNGTVASLAAMALKAARRELARKAGERLCSRTWRLEGGAALDSAGKGLWTARIYPADALRLRHVPSGRCICPAFREMETDLASVPEIAKRVARHFPALHLEADSYARSAIFHDALYEAGWCWVVEGRKASRAPVTRAQADAILYLCLCCEGATAADGFAYHAGVRAGGASHWRKARRETATWPLLFDGAAGPI